MNVLCLCTLAVRSDLTYGAPPVESLDVVVLLAVARSLVGLVAERARGIVLPHVARENPRHDRAYAQPAGPFPI
jgi:hypothetical protein